MVFGVLIGPYDPERKKSESSLTFFMVDEVGGKERPRELSIELVGGGAGTGMAKGVPVGVRDRMVRALRYCSLLF